MAEYALSIMRLLQALKSHNSQTFCKEAYYKAVTSFQTAVYENVTGTDGLMPDVNRERSRTDGGGGGSSKVFCKRKLQAGN
jgi:hypothetical protein